MKEIQSFAANKIVHGSIAPLVTWINLISNCLGLEFNLPEWSDSLFSPLIMRDLIVTSSTLKFAGVDKFKVCCPALVNALEMNLRSKP